VIQATSWWAKGGCHVTTGAAANGVGPIGLVRLGANRASRYIRGARPRPGGAVGLGDVGVAGRNNLMVESWLTWLHRASDPPVRHL
jgi:hypothetical protein